jgi:ABC-type polysaccharide/polyol phosphate transport system ATPase subunit
VTSASTTTADQERRDRLDAAPTAITVDGVHKRFKLPHQQYHTMKERLLHPFRSMAFDELNAVNGVSLEIKQGEFFGIVGRNGSGKSTLLKCLAGIYKPDSGRVVVRGRLSPFIELGVGFNPDLTARDNVVINAVMMGLSRKEARRAFDEVVAFAELEEFVDLKLKNYSSGMAVRLGFATAIQVDADVLLVDEVLAVGDAAFQQKCFEEFHRMRSAGKTIVFVTHDMASTERFCDRAMLIERGDVVMVDEPHQIARAYNEMNFGRLVHTADEDDEGEGGRYGDRSACEIVDAWFEVRGERIAQVAHGEPLEIVTRVRFTGTVEEPVFGVTVRNELGHTIFATTTEMAHTPPETYDAGDDVLVRVCLDTWFSPSQYKLTPSVARKGSGANALDLREDLTSLYVHATRATGGIVDLPHTMVVERS